MGTSYAASIEPEFFPLSKSMIERLAKDRHLVPSVRPSTSLDEQVQILSREFPQMWVPLLREIDALRDQATDALFNALESTSSFSTDAFIELLKTNTPPLEKKTQKTGDGERLARGCDLPTGRCLGKMPQMKGDVKPFTTRTVSRWRSAGLLRDEFIETQLAILMMRMADRWRERGFLPTRKNEPYMYVWRKDGPKSVAVPCGLPLSSDIPSHALLFSRFRLLGTLHKEWLPFGDYGSVRWAGVVADDLGRTFWDMTSDGIRHWDPSVVDFGEGVFNAVVTQTRHTLANLILLRQATEIFQSSPV